MFARAESQSLKDRVPEKKRKWRVIYCPNGHKIEYEPKEGFIGELKCPECAVNFKVPLLDEYLNE